MPVDAGSQTLSLKFGAPGNSAEVNRRFVDVRPVGIYEGGVLSVVDSTHTSLTALVCEIGDGTHQVRIATTTAISVVVGSAIPYIILRWSYTGTTSDYMEVLAVNGTSILVTDLVVAKCAFSGGGALNGFDYGDGSYPRTHPNTQDFSLGVVPATGLRMYIQPGYFQDSAESTLIPFQLTDALSAPAANSKIFLVYIDTATGTVVVDSSGTAAAAPVAPVYNGKLVLAEVTLASTTTTITASMIKDVRPHVTYGKEAVDGTSVTRTTAGVLKAVDKEYIVTRQYGAQLQGQASWTPMTNIGTVVKVSGLASPVSGVFTLGAGLLYKINYNLLFQRVSGSPVFQARFRVLSGDLSWYLADDDTNQSNTKGEIFSSTSSPKQLDGTWLILPATATTMRVEVITKDTDNYETHVLSGVISIWT